MTQITNTRTFGSRGLSKKTVLQMLAVTAVAVAGISFGRWVVPAGSSDAVSAAPDTSAAAAISQHNVDSGRLDSILFPEAVLVPDTSASVVDTTSAAAIISQRKFDSGRLEGILFPAGPVAAATSSSSSDSMSAAAIITLHKFESGRLDEILFGTD